VYVVLGIVSIGFGGILLLGSHEIWRLYFNGPETCQLGPPIPQEGPTCASIVTTIATLAAVGGIFVGVGPVLLFMGKDEATPRTLPPTATSS